MTLPLWGLLQRSQDDPETIEEAIERIVQEHNADPESHLQEGESLESHKTEDVIDHPPGSVLFDKITSRELWRSYMLIAAEGWEFDPDNSAGSIPGFRIGLTDTVNTVGFVRIQLGLGNFTIPQVGIESLFHCSLKFSDFSEEVSAFWGIRQVAPANHYGIYFEWDGTDVILRARTSTENIASSAITVDVEEFNSYRWHYDPVEEEINAYINGELAATISGPTTGDYGTPRIYFRLDDLTLSDEAHIDIYESKIATFIT